MLEMLFKHILSFKPSRGFCKTYSRNREHECPEHERSGKGFHIIPPQKIFALEGGATNVPRSIYARPYKRGEIV